MFEFTIPDGEYDYDFETCNIHVNDSTEFSAERVTDFVVLKIGDVDLFISNAEQAVKLADAAADAFAILIRMEDGLKANQMLEAGKTWIRAIWDDREIHDFSSISRWNLDDWVVVMNRHGSFVPTQKDVDEFRASSSSKYLRGLK